MPDMTPEEHQRRGDAADALFRDIMRPAHDARFRAFLVIVVPRFHVDRRCSLRPPGDDRRTLQRHRLPLQRRALVLVGRGGA